ncbi:hypothetical protein [uncultured Jannaschia sp.]|uniref:hypothetical protein n=1 Tax=uncultured Jannaschia sp. TaxID=293347 RepID=UPI002631EC2C|nr:hypothetical protein [uncultured Jannaschia sp.]
MIEAFGQFLSIVAKDLEVQQLPILGDQVEPHHIVGFFDDTGNRVAVPTRSLSRYNGLMLRKTDENAHARTATPFDMQFIENVEVCELLRLKDKLENLPFERAQTCQSTSNVG